MGEILSSASSVLGSESTEILEEELNELSSDSGSRRWPNLPGFAP